MSTALPEPTQLNTPELLEAFFDRSQDGFFFMMLDKPVEWGPGVDKDAVLDYVFTHQRMTKVNPAMAQQFRATTPAALIGMTPAEFFRHDLEGGRSGWRKLFDAGHTHSVTNERRLDGSTMWVEGDYMCFYDAAGRITGHFGIQRDVTDRTLAEHELEQSRTELRALAARLLAIREEERTRIAREIHDELGQVLTGLKMEVTWVAQRLDAKQKNLHGKTQSMCGLIDSAIQTVRKIASGLRPEILDEMGLVAAIDWQAKDFQKRTGIRTRVELPPEGIKLDLERSTTTFRIFQEILTNVARHAHATRVEVKFDITDAHMTLEVADNGVGIPEAKLNGKSLGLLGIQERALHLNGDVAISGTSGQGTRVTVNIPLADAQ